MKVKVSCVLYFHSIQLSGKDENGGMSPVFWKVCVIKKKQRLSIETIESRNIKPEHTVFQGGHKSCDSQIFKHCLAISEFFLGKVDIN